MKRKLVLVAIVLALVSIGCSQVDAPELGDHGSITLRFSRSTDAVDGPALLSSPGSDALQEALAIADYAVVKVFRPGVDAELEISAGEAIPDPPATLNMELSVIAENNKRVAVELFEAGDLIYFGVNEDVDVGKNSNSHVSIVASQFEAGAIWHTPTQVGTGAAWQIRWDAIDGADWYRIQESTNPAFTVITWEGTTSNTFLDINADEVPAGDFYYRVAGENPYSRSDYSTAMPVHVYGPPVVETFTAVAEGMRGERISVTVTGQDLDYPGSYPSCFGQSQTITAWSRTAMQVEVDIPDGAFSDLLTVTNPFGSDDSDDIVFVQNIAYIMGNSTSGDGETAAWYKKEIDDYGAPLWFSHVVIIPEDFLGLFGDLQMFDVIIAGWDTGTDPSDWAGGDSYNIGLVNDSEAMVLGIGIGGAALFEALGLDIGLYNAFGINQDDVYVFDDTNPIYSTPNPINIPIDNYLPIYSSNAYQIPIFVDLLNPPVGVSYHARQTAANTFFPLIDQEFFGGGSGQKTTCFFWGFHEKPDYLTVRGASLTENVIVGLFQKRLGQSVP